MEFDRGAADRQAHAHAFRLGREERREQALGHFRRDAVAVVDHGHGHLPLRVRAWGHAGSDAQHAPLRIDGLHRLDRVARQVQQDLLDQHAVGQHRRQVGRDVDLQRHVALARLQVDQGADAVDHVRNRHRLAARLALLDEFVHAADDLPRAPRLRVGLFQRAPQHAGVDRGARTVAVARACQDVQCAGRVAGDGGQRLVQFVRQHRRDLAHRGQARARLQLFLLLAIQFLGALAVGDVEDGAHPARVAAVDVDQRRLEHEHGHAHAVRALEHGLELRRGLARQHEAEAVLVVRQRFRRPVRHRRFLAEQVFRRQADHAAERRVDVGDAALQVARAQAREQRVFHRGAERHLLAQRVLGRDRARDVAPQCDERDDEAQRQHDHRADQQVRQQLRRTLDAVGGEHDLRARQVERALVRVDAAARSAGGPLGHDVVVAVEQRQRVVLGEPPRHVLVQQRLQVVRGDEAAHVLAGVVQRQMEIDQAVHEAGRAVRLAVAAETRAARHRGGVARRLRQPLGRQFQAAHRLRLAVGAEPDDAAQFVAVLEHLREARLQRGRSRRLDGEIGAEAGQRLLAARQFEAQGLLDPQRVGDQLLLALVAFHLARLPGQPQQDEQEQQHEQHGHEPAPRSLGHGPGQGKRCLHCDKVATFAGERPSWFSTIAARRRSRHTDVPEDRYPTIHLPSLQRACNKAAITLQ